MTESLLMTSPVSNILLVDDEPTNLRALEAILEPLEANVVRATSCREALGHALRDEYAVILLDVRMPGIDGFATAELLRRGPRTRGVPIIFLTAIGGESELVSRGHGGGAVDYLFKPYEPDVLRAKVSVFVELSRKNERALAQVKKQSEQRYADLADSVPLLVWTTDGAGRLRYGNRRWNALARGTREVAAVVAPDDLSRFEAGWTTALATGEEWEAELRLGNVEDGWRAHLVRVVPRRDDDGRITSWVGTSTDIDARVRAERSLRMLAEASRRLGTTLEGPMEIEAVLRGALPILGDLAMLDLLEAGARIKLAAGVAPVEQALPVSLLDDPRFDLGPSTVADSGRPETYLDVRQELADAHSGRSLENLRFLEGLGVGAYMCLPLASRGRCIGTLTLVRGNATAPYEAAEVALAEDLARRIAVAADNARLHETTERRREALEQANRSKDVFLATLSHELRTPLNAIVGWTDMMRNGRLAPDELGRAVETIGRNAHALNHLVADLLDVSRIVTGSLKIDSNLVGLASVVEAAIEAARPQCSAKRVVLDVSIARVGCVRGDAGRLRQVIGNLLSNAIKFTPTGGRIVVGVTRVEEGGRVAVEDTGEGIAPELLPHVFERFQQAEEAKARGLGLGLAIVRHLVEEHGGTVSASSEGAGQGALFTVTLPIVAEEALAEDVDAGCFSMRLSAPPQLAGVHVLVVEDDPDGNELITAVLERYGARVTSVGTAADALDALDEKRPDVVVSDIGLPDADGLELIRMIRARAFGRDVPAIALTAYASRQDAARALAAGFDAHVAKPVQPETLGTAVARLVAAGRDDATKSPSTILVPRIELGDLAPTQAGTSSPSLAPLASLPETRGSRHEVAGGGARKGRS